jgi:hypothetical protein
MTKKIKVLLNISIFFILISCNSDKKNDYTYFGGKIINPKSNLVVLYTMEKVIDTFFLDSKNRFFGKIKKANEGLYYFNHDDENQYVYIEPKDSLMLRLNTWDFDESLVFAGKGAERNNILIDCFLENENDRKLFYSFNKLNPKEFRVKVDSLLNLKMITYHDYINNHPEETSGYKNTLKTALTFPIYARLEKYPFINARNSKDGNFPKLEESYYNYRKEITIINDSLMYYPPYSRFISNHLYNETYALGHPPVKSEFTSQFTIDLLKTINKKISVERTRNAILRQTVISHFYNKSSCKINKDAFETFFELSTNKKDKDLITRLLKDTNSIPLHQKLPEFEITNYTNANQDVSDIIKNKNTFLLFWSPEYVSKEYLATRMNYLSNNYPNIQFIQVKIDGNSDDRIRKIDIKNQFYLKADSDAHQFLTSKMPRTVLIDKKGKVVNAYAAISSVNLISFLEELNQN